MRLTILLTFVLWFSQNGFSQYSDSLIHYSVENGLAGNFIFRAYQDSKGFMWFPTNRGLTRFDGSRFKNFVDADVKNLVLRPLAVGEDSHQRLWLYTASQHFCYFDLQKNRFFATKNNTDAPKLSYITYFLEASPKKLIIHTSNQIIYELDENLNIVSWKKNTQKVAITPKNYPKINADVSMFSYTKDSIYTHFKGVNLPSNIVHYPSGYAIARVYTDSAFFYVQGQNLGVFSRGKTLVKNILDISGYKNALNLQIFDVGSPKRALVKSDKVFFVVDENLNRLPEFDFINKYDLNTIYFDKKDNLWICTRENGIYLKIREKKPAILPVYLEKKGVYQLANDKKGNLFIGNNLGEIFTFRDTTYRKLNIQNSPKAPITQMYFDSKGNLFVAWKVVGYAKIQSAMLYGDAPMVVKNACDLKPENEPKPYFKSVAIPYKPNEISLILSADVRSYCENTEGDIFISTGNHLRILKDSMNHLTNKVFGLNRYIVSMSEAGKDALWIASSGLYKIRKGNITDSLTAVKKKQPYLISVISSMLKDKRGYLWGAQNDVGFYRMDTTTFNAQVIKEMANSFVIQTVLDNKSRVWAATNKGVTMVEVISTSPFKYRFKKIDKTMGLASNEVLSIAVNDSFLFASTAKGLSVFNLSKVLSDENLVKSDIALHFSNIKINQKDTILRGSYDLRYDENNLEIEFAGHSFNPQNPMRYEYQMQKDGTTEADWRTTNEPNLIFSFLPAGKYTLHVRAFDAENHILEMAQPIVFNVRLPFWKTSWFVGSILAFLGVLAWFLYKNNIKRIQKEEAAKAEISKQFTVLELQALQAQMNPHFVFNALTAIQNFIWNKDVKAANEYLTEFSTLMRLFLESSRRKYLTVEEEVKLLKIYVHLEQLRFPDRFDATFDVEENINPSDELPSMLIQPFVENAINHGLLYKKEKGLLQIHFSKGNNILTCVVEDNGVGRDAAAAKRASSMKAHKSRATEILQERIALMKSVEGMVVTVNIEDKNFEQFQDLGTKVLIEIKEV